MDSIERLRSELVLIRACRQAGMSISEIEQRAQDCLNIVDDILNPNSYFDTLLMHKAG